MALGKDSSPGQSKRYWGGDISLRGWKSKEQLSLKAKMPYSSGGWPFFEGPGALVESPKHVSPTFLAPAQDKRAT